MVKRRTLVPLVFGLMLILGLTAGCNNTLDNNVATLNAAATRAASGDLGLTLPSVPGLTPGEPGATTPANVYDLSVDQSATLAHAWGQVYGLPGGSEFMIVATQAQASDFVIDTLQLGGWQDSVRGGTVTIGRGQARVDVALIIGEDGDPNQQFGSGTVTFQPTLDGLGRLRLNPLGGDFGTLDIPSNLPAAMGDAVHTLLTGARDDTLSRVSLTLISLENGMMQVQGRVR